ncbi:AMP-binding protein [Candidatus Marithrix sp. Canyon 246]|uniref:AMP-binding protein n=1 Tax=Candidatus Marithrix sp. Canyon 246 TaxID=1827136 RepID=UPI000849F414|nr:class I adenylate-forming enzyme family protein [Candidatus Marithrix sp. Canyon 246]
MLANTIYSLEPQHKLWHISASRIICAGELTNFLFDSYSYIIKYQSQKIALSVKDMKTLALLLVMFDGVCEQILLLPQGLSEDQIKSFFKLSGTKIFFSDQEITFDTNDVGSVIFNPDIFGSKKESKKDSSVSPYINFTAHDTNWIIPTSGTTGTPKLVSHNLNSLTKTINRDINKGKLYNWGLLYDLTRFAGLQVFLQSLMGGSLLIFTEPLETLEKRISVLVKAKCSALSATPTMWRKILMSENAKQLALKQITLGGEIADNQILLALKATYPKARLIHIYASTEAGVGFVVNDGFEGFPVSYLNNPPKGIELVVNQQGFLLLRSKQTTQQYLDKDQILKENDGFINTGDLVKKVGERFIFLGRANGAINVGGNKVQPEEVEEVIRSYEGVKFVSIGARKNPITGSLVEAKIVIDKNIKDSTDFKKSLREHCRQYLEPYKIPGIIKIVDDIEINAMGKLQRK